MWPATNPIWPGYHKVPTQILDFVLSLPVCRQRLKPVKLDH